MSQITTATSGGGGGGGILSVTGDLGAAVSPNGSGNLNVIGDGSIITKVVDPSTHTFIITTSDEVVLSLAGDVGTTTPIDHTAVIQSAADSILNTFADAGAITVDLDQGLNGQVPICATGASTRYANITSLDSSVTITNGANTIDLSVMSSGGGTISTTYTSSDTWTKNVNTKYVCVFIWDGGSGGGSGRQGTTGNAGGGSGGAPGGTAYFYGPALFFPPSTPVGVGAGGTGGISQAFPDSDGSSGFPWGSSTFGALSTYAPSSFQGGSVGLGGVNGTAVGGSYGGNLTTYLAVQIASPSPSSGNGTLTDGSSSSSISVISLMSSTAGGGGAGADSGTPFSGGRGGDIVDLLSASVLLGGGSGGNEFIAIDGGNGANQDGTLSFGFMTGGSGGGGGGGQSSGPFAGNGGNGGFPGGGGGGGGGSLNGTSSGFGGNGGNGQVIVIEFT